MIYQIHPTIKVRQCFRMAKNDQLFRSECLEIDDEVEKSLKKFFPSAKDKLIISAVYIGWYLGKYGADNYKEKML